MKEVKYENAASTVTLILRRRRKGRDYICLIKRKEEPYKGLWALPGGFLNYKQENLPTAGKRELKEETGYRTRVRDLSLLLVNSEVDRDPRDHVIDHVYEVKRFYGKGKAGDDAEDKRWVELSQAIKLRLAFDHRSVLKYYQTRRNKYV